MSAPSDGRQGDGQDRDGLSERLAAELVHLCGRAASSNSRWCELVLAAARAAAQLGSTTSATLSASRTSSRAGWSRAASSAGTARG